MVVVVALGGLGDLRRAAVPSAVAATAAAAAFVTLLIGCICLGF